MNADSQQKKIKIVFLLPSLLLGGGIETHLVKMLPLFNRSRFTLSLVTLFEYSHRPNMYDRLPKDVSVTRLSFRNAFDFSGWRALIRTLRMEHPDIVMSSMFSANAAARVLKPLLGFRVIVREHNTYTDKRWYHHFLDGVLARWSDAIVAVSTEVAEFASKKGRFSLKQVTVINNGVDFEKIRSYVARAGADVARVRNELGLSPETRIVLNVARIKPQKDHALLIEAFADFVQTHPSHVLVIAGDGSERPVVEQLITERGLTGKVFLVGYRSDVYTFFAAADFFVLSSRREGFPNVGLEAMAFGLPFITTQVAGVEEFVEKGSNGLIVERSPEALSVGMSSIADLSTQERLVYTKRCVETAHRFDMVSIVHRYEALCENVLTHE